MSRRHGSTGVPRHPTGSSGHGATGNRTPLMPEVMDAMSAAVRRRRAPTRRRRWLGRGVALVLVGALGSGTALAATGQWNPFGDGHRKAYTLAPAPSGDIAALAVLRRPQSAQDQSPLMAGFLRLITRVSEESGGQAHVGGRVYLRSVRYLRDVESTEMGGWNGRWHRQTRPAILVIVPSDLVIPGITEPQHAKGVQPTRAALRRAAAITAATPPRPHHQLCVYTIVDSWPAGGQPPMMLRAPKPKHSKRAAVLPKRPALLQDRISGGGSCVSAHTLRMKGVVEGAFNDGALTGVVPDGVAAVRITTRTGRVMTQKVVNNSFQLLAPGRDKLVANRIPDGRVVWDMPAKSAQFKHQTLQWLAADGRIIRHVPL